MDTLSKRERSRRMAAVRSTGNKATELKLISIFRANGITGWRRNQHLAGKPDFVFRRERVAVFVDGCFWHGCRRHCRTPRSHRSYWQRKIARNVARDRSTTRALRASGWRVVRVWEHSLKTPRPVAERIKSALCIVGE